MMSSLVGRGDAPLCPVVVLCWIDDFPWGRESVTQDRACCLELLEMGTERIDRARVWARVPRPLDLGFSLAHVVQWDLGLDRRFN